MPRRRRLRPSQRSPSAPERTVRERARRGCCNTHAITPAQYGQYNGTFSAAIASEKRLRGTRKTELEAVVNNLHAIAASGQLTPSRLPVLFETLARNRQWWTTGPLLSSGQRVEFSGSNLVWQYYPGQGIELQVLGTFGKADGLYTAGSAEYPQLIALLNEMIPLAAQRGGGLTWEYYFKFDGGNPPWTSAMAQGTALEALTRGFQASGDGNYLQIAQQALPIFTRRAEDRRRERTTGRGIRYLQYTFAPSVSIINAFLQTLIGLYDYALESDNPEAMSLFQAGNAEAMAEVPHFDTGAWSLYQPGVEDDLSYHELVTGFLQQLCQRTDAPVYCTTADHFETYLKTPPVLTLLTTQRPACPPGIDRVPAVEGLARRNRRFARDPDGFRDKRHASRTASTISRYRRSSAPAHTRFASPRPTWPATSPGSSARCRSPRTGDARPAFGQAGSASNRLGRRCGRGRSSTPARAGSARRRLRRAQPVPARRRASARW